MFEPTTPQPPVQNPLNPVMPSAGMSNTQFPAPSAPPPFTPPQAPIHTMPERFRSTGASSGGPKGSGKTKKLIITLIVVVVVAGLGVGGLYVFNRVVKSNTNNANANITNTTNQVTATSFSIESVGGNIGLGNSNTSTNENTNATSNVNAVNGNANIAANVNSTTNGNANTSTNTNTSTVTGPLPSTADQDADGLTDTEEVVYGTDAANTDTDGDTFIDGRQTRADGTVVGELVGLYNPKGTGTLESSSLVKRIENSTKSYSLLVPTAWTINESSGLMVVTPTQQTGEFFQIRVLDNTSNQTLQQWYQANNPQANMSLVKSVAVNGLEGLISEDAANAYFLKDTKIYSLSYTATGLSQLNYWTTFTMMMKSFKLVATS